MKWIGRSGSALCVVLRKYTDYDVDGPELYLVPVYTALLVPRLFYGQGALLG